MEELERELHALSTAFASLGRILLCIDPDFIIAHASGLVDTVYGDGTADSLRGRDLAEVLGEDLFGAHGALRSPLELGERREGWRATLRLPDGESQLVSITAAPLSGSPEEMCSPHVAFIVVIRPAGDELALVPEGPASFEGLVARAPAMLKIIALIQSPRHSEATVLLTGDSGTGKEVVARAIHRSSHRRGGRFVGVNCGALPGELLESELFGHARGAFTGAIRDRVGRFELASSGTLFLDEVGDVPLHLQVKLLRVLQERAFERLGESDSRHTDARIIAATNVDLRRAVAEGRFREDLYYRLRVVPLEIPPLRHRREDIEPLTAVLLARVNDRQGRAVRLSPHALRLLLRHDWPGNVRELENALEFAVAVCQRQTILPEDLPHEVQHPAAHFVDAEAPLIPRVPVSSPTPAPDAETELLRQALDENRWRREETARALGMSRTTLWRKMREHGLS